MIALFKRTPPAVSEAVELAAIVARIPAMEVEAHRMLFGADAVQIREPALASAKELAVEQKKVADIPGAPTAWGCLGEGYWEVVPAELSATAVGRYAREARHWLERHSLAVQRWAAGQGMEPWTKENRGNHPSCCPWSASATRRVCAATSKTW